MKLAIILSSSRVEINWNALRLANLALSKNDTVSVFLVSEGVEYTKNTSSQFDVKKQGVDKECPAGNLEDWYLIIAESNKFLTF